MAPVVAESALRSTRFAPSTKEVNRICDEFTTMAKDIAKYKEVLDKICHRLETILMDADEHMNNPERTSEAQAKLQEALNDTANSLDAWLDAVEDKLKRLAVLAKNTERMLASTVVTGDTPSNQRMSVSRRRVVRYGLCVCLLIASLLTGIVGMVTFLTRHVE